jgi:TetR/AcrR family transcriptional regulator, repressor for uid operon
MANSSTSREAILAATRRAIAERGPGKLTLSAIATAAGVSRPTLYRWFPTKDALLSAIAVYEEEQFDLGLRAVIDSHRSPARRLDATLRYLVNYVDGLMGPDPIGADVHFALQSLASSLSVQCESLVRLLGDAFQQVPAVRSGELSSEQAVELLLRLAYSHYLIPHPEPEVLLANLRSFAGLPRRSAIRATG